MQKKCSFEVGFRLKVAEIADIIELVLMSARSYYVITLQREAPEINSSRLGIIVATLE